MAKLEGFRLVNVHANHNSIVYPNEYFFIEGKNALLDMKNGGGKTLASQMLFQTVLPNSFFSDKNQVLNLFSGVTLGSTVHSVSHFSIEGHQFKNIYLGFAAMAEPKNSDETSDVIDNSDLGLKYMNYIIAGNNLEADLLSIETLPLCKMDENSITPANYKSLKDFLQTKMKSEKHGRYYVIQTFENEKSRYYQELKKFGINSEVFEFLREINKDENYIKQFFEEKCKRPKDLLMNFIVPNTEKALDARAFVMNMEKVDRSSQLAESLFEKSQSLNELNKFQADKAEYERLKQEISSFVEFVNGRVSILEEYDIHLKEYPKQAAAYVFTLRQMEEYLRELESQHAIHNEKKSNIENDIENIEIRKLQIKLEKLNKIFANKVLNVNKINAEVEENQQKKLKLETINLIIDYKQHESEKNGIDERLDKLTNVHYDDKKVTAEFANTICIIANKEITNSKSEFEEYKAHLIHENEKLNILRKNEGVLGERLERCQLNISSANDKKYNLECTLLGVDKELMEYTNYSNSLLDEEELKCLEELMVNFETELEDTSAAISKNKEDYIKAQYDLERTASIICIHNESLAEKNEWVETYKKSLEEIKAKTAAREGNVNEIREQFKTQLESNASKTVVINKSIGKLQEEIQILEDYGFLRERSKYDALNAIKGDWKYAKFGSDILKELDEEKSQKILDRFPGFAEVLIVSDDDYNRVSEGKKSVSLKVAQENLVLMPWSIIKKFEEEVQFTSLFLLTRDGKYYKNLLNPNIAIELRNKEIDKLLEREKALNSEKAIIIVQINLLDSHIHKYPLETVKKYLGSIRKLNDEISELVATKLQQEQSIRTLELRAEELKDILQKLKSGNTEVIEKHKFLVSKISLSNQISEIQLHGSELIEEKSNLEYEIDNLNADRDLAQKKKEHLEKSIERVKENINKYNSYIENTKGYEDESFDTLKERDIASLYSKFLVAKKSFDEKAQNYDELVERQSKLNILMKDIREDYRFGKIDFSEIYALNYLQKAVTGEFEALNLKIDDLNNKKFALEEEKSNAKAELITYEMEYAKRENKITVYFEKFKIFDEQELFTLERENKAELSKVDDQIGAIKKNIDDTTVEMSSYKNELVQFKVFCETNNLIWQTAVKPDIMVSYSEMQKSYVKVKAEYDKAINRINLEIKKLYSTVDKLTINEQLKLKLKEYLKDKHTFEETVLLVKLVLQTSEGIYTTIKNLETSIENIGRLDEEIAEQVYRMLKTILDEIAKIPEYSKFKYGDYTKESFKINLSDENSCRIENDIALSRLKAYVYELAYFVQNDGMTKKEIKNRLSINNIIQYGMDFDKLNIQILKIEQEKHKYYSWGRLSASSGQSYVTYVMFAITMVKYFNNVTVISDKMKAPIFIFLDNPFASASSIELWEPVRRFLDKSNAQLLCVAHNVPSSAQILFDKHMIIEQTKNSKGQYINTIRNEKTESNEIIQMQIFDHLEIK